MLKMSFGSQSLIWLCCVDEPLASCCWHDYHPCTHYAYVCFHMQCTQYVREYFPMMFALLKQEVVSGVRMWVWLRTYVSKWIVLCLLNLLDYTCMEFGRWLFGIVLSSYVGMIAVICLWISHKDDGRWQLSLGVVLVICTNVAFTEQCKKLSYTLSLKCRRFKSSICNHCVFNLCPVAFVLVMLCYVIIISWKR